MNTVFFGASHFVLPILDVLRKNYTLSLVVTTEKLPTDAVPAYCIDKKIPYLSCQQFNNETIEQLKLVNAPFAVLAYLGVIIPKSVLDLFPQGIINIHPSLLPKYRGPTPGQAAILAGEETSGVSIIKLDEEVDHGPILAQQEIAIAPTDTADSFYENAFNLGAPMLIDLLPDYLAGVLKPKPQEHTKAPFTKRLRRTDGYIDRTNLPTKERLDRMIRAYYPWPSVWTGIRIKNQESRIKLLPNQNIQLEGRKPMSYKDFINGYAEGEGILRSLGLF